MQLYYFGYKQSDIQSCQAPILFIDVDAWMELCTVWVFDLIILETVTILEWVTCYIVQYLQSPRLK